MSINWKTGGLLVCFVLSRACSGRQMYYPPTEAVHFSGGKPLAIPFGISRWSADAGTGHAGRFRGPSVDDVQADEHGERCDEPLKYREAKL